MFVSLVDKNYRFLTQNFTSCNVVDLVMQFHDVISWFERPVAKSSVILQQFSTMNDVG